MSNQLIVGIILIVAGIALALLAYAFILNRREPEAQEEGRPAEQAKVEEPETEPVAPEALPAWAKRPEAAVEAAAVEPPPPAPPAQPPPAPAPPVPEAQPVAAATLPPSRRTLAVATLLRDEISGNLLVLVGDREYATADELRGSRDYTRVERAAADLAQWLGAPAVRECGTERAAKDDLPKKPTSMIEQINEILQHKVMEVFGSTRGIRLVAGPGGALRVYFGLQSYALEDIPDEQIKRMMREAVAEWEAKQ